MWNQSPSASFGALDYSNNSPGWDRGSELLSAPGGFSIWRHPDGTIYHSDANGEWVLEPAGNGLYWDTMYGAYRNQSGAFVNADGSVIVTPYSEKYYSTTGTSDPWRLWGSSGANARLGTYAGVDLTTLRDGNNTPITGNYGRTPTTPTGGGVPTTPVNTGGNTGGNQQTGGTNTNGTTTTGTGLTPGTTNPYSLPINFFFGMPTSGTGTDTGTTQQQSTVDPLSWLSLLNLGYGSSTYGYPTYQSADPGEGGINYVQPNSQTVEFRSPFTY